MSNLNRTFPLPQRETAVVSGGYCPGDLPPNKCQCFRAHLYVNEHGIVALKRLNIPVWRIVSIAEVMHLGASQSDIEKASKIWPHLTKAELISCIGFKVMHPNIIEDDSAKESSQFRSAKLAEKVN